MKNKWKVVHSVSKDAWNVVNTELGGKYKIARVPYLVCGDYEFDIIMKTQAENIAQLISKAPEMREVLEELHKYGSTYGMPYDVYEKLGQLLKSTKL